MTNIMQQIESSGVIAVVRLPDLSTAVPLTEALIAGGITIIEFTLTNPNATHAITATAKAIGSRGLIGAGSITTPEQVDSVVDAGAAFIVSPVTKPEVIERCQHHNVPTMPGAYTPTEIQHAWELGASAVKVFPARDLGPTYIKDVLAPLPHLRLIPTGGINAKNAGNYIRAGVVAVGVGGSLLDKTAIQNRNWDAITTSAKELTEAVQAART